MKVIYLGTFVHLDGEPVTFRLHWKMSYHPLWNVIFDDDENFLQRKYAFGVCG